LAKESLGKKRSCPDCGTLFYDLRRKNIVCPKCGADYLDPKTIKAKRTPEPVAKEPVLAPAEQVVVGNDDEDGDLVDDGIGAETVDNDEENDELIENTSDLGAADDDMSEIKNHIDSGVEDKG